MALWGLLWFTNFLNIPDIHIYGDFNIIIDQVNGCASIKKPLLLGWLVGFNPIQKLFAYQFYEHKINNVRA